MPGFDKTGPMGMGPISGRGFGPCGLGLGWRRKFGQRRGLGRYFGCWNWPQTKKDQVQALKEYQQKLIDTNVRIFVRRGGPNYQEGLENMKKLGEQLGIPVEVYGPETHMTRIVDLALKGS